MLRMWMIVSGVMLATGFGCNDGAVDSAKKEAASLADAAKEAVESIKEFKLGDVDLKKAFTDISIALQQEIYNITDRESAQAALPKFNEVLGQIKQLKKTFGKLPENVRQAFAKYVGTETVTLRSVMEVAEENYGEGVGDVVKSVFRSILKELESFK